MMCPKCQSENVSVQVQSEFSMKDKHKGCLWWCFIGCWWVPTKWLVFTLPAIIFKIFGHKKQRIVAKQKTVCLCQNCGNKWEV